MKKKSNGFTLTELLAVIVVLTIIITIASSSVISIMNRSKKNMAEEIRGNLKESALSYAMEKYSLKKCPLNFNPTSPRSTDAGCYIKIKISTLISEGFFEDNRKDANEKGFCNTNDEVIVYHYTYKNNINETLGEYRAYVSDSVCNN